MPPPEFPKGRKLSKLHFKQPVSARREETSGWQARERAVFPLPTPPHPEGRNQWERQDPNCKPKELSWDHQPSLLLSLELLQSD